MDVWARLEHAFARRAERAADPPTPPGGRLGAVLALLHVPADEPDDVVLVLTRRREDLAHHPGQVAFPGGRVEAGETVEDAAVREAAEEIGLDASTVTVLGRLPAFYIPPSRFWLAAVVARWDAPHPLVASEAEVAEILRVRLSQLRDAACWRVVRRAAGRGQGRIGAAVSWAWQLDERHLLWGATAVVTAALLEMIDPNWHGGLDPATLAPDREVRPWEEPGYAVVPHAALLPDVPELPLAGVPVDVPDGRAPATSRASIRAAGEAVAGGVSRLAGGSVDPRVVVLAGPGATGAVGLAAARALAVAGHPVRVVLAVPGEKSVAQAQAELNGLECPVSVFDGDLAEGGVVVDALVGTGLVGPLGPPLREIVLALRHHSGLVVAIDLPSGVDPRGHLVGDAVAADCTVALGLPQPALTRPGLAPYVGDLYLADLGHAGARARREQVETVHAPLVRLVR